MGRAGNKLKKTVPNHQTADPWLTGLMVNLTCDQDGRSLRGAEVQILPLMEETLRNSNLLHATKIVEGVPYFKADLEGFCGGWSLLLVLWVTPWVDSLSGFPFSRPIWSKFILTPRPSRSFKNGNRTVSPPCLDVLVSLWSRARLVWALCSGPHLLHALHVLLGPRPSSPIAPAPVPGPFILSPFLDSLSRLPHAVLGPAPSLRSPRVPPNSSFMSSAVSRSVI